MALWTVEDLPRADGTLHPAQEAMVECHGSQCGFCTPGFVMSLFGMYQNHAARPAPCTRQELAEELSGNLCRCTGYRPILDAAQRMAELPRQRWTPRRCALLTQLRATALQHDAPSAAFGMTMRAADRFAAPRHWPTAGRGLRRVPQAQLVAGCTDVGLWVTKQLRELRRHHLPRRRRGTAAHRRSHDGTCDRRRA